MARESTDRAPIRQQKNRLDHSGFNSSLTGRQSLENYGVRCVGVGDAGTGMPAFAWSAWGRAREHSRSPTVRRAPTASAIAHLRTACSRSTMLTRSVSFLSLSLIFDNRPANDCKPSAIGPVSLEGMESKPVFFCHLVWLVEISVEDQETIFSAAQVNRPRTSIED